MSLGPIPVVAIGTLSGTLPAGAGAKTLGAPVSPSGGPAGVVSLNESNAITGVTLNPFSEPKISADTPEAASFQQQLLLAQAQV